MPKKIDHGSWYANHLNNLLRLLGLLVMACLAVLAYRYLLSDIVEGKSHFIAYIVIWLLTTYVVLPRLYRLFSKLYLPNYFFGRTQTADGLLGDPINLAFIGHESQIVKAMEIAGWTKAEKISLKSSLRMVYSAVRSAKYPSAPVSSLFVFGRKQDFAFERDLHGNPRKRHHIRFWRTPEHWWLPGGYKADWLAAATFDKNVGLSLFTGQVTHKIDADVDVERDFVIESIKKANKIREVKIIKHFTSSYHSRNGGGDMIHTDGSLPFIDLK
jgi:hypothetical protein